MAVPSGSMSSCTSSSWRSSTAVSVVGGDFVRLWPAKITRPMRSRRAPLHELGHHLLAPPSSRLRGWKSSAAIEPETSRATTMSTPCGGDVLAQGAVLRAREGDRAQPRGRARRARAGRWRRRTRQPGRSPREARRARERRRRPPVPLAAAGAPRGRAAPSERGPAATPGPGSGSRPSPSGRLPVRRGAGRGPQPLLERAARAPAPRRGVARPPARGPAPRANLIWSAASARSRTAGSRSPPCGVAAQEGERLRGRHLEDRARRAGARGSASRRR